MKFQTYGKLTQLVVATGLATLLVSCGGTATTGGGAGGSGDVAVDTNDDGVVDAADGDLNGDGFLTDADFDFNSDGLIDDNDDVNQDDVVNADDFDINGDGVTDANDDVNGDGAVNLADESLYGQDCVGGSGTDRDSSTNAWNDNCFLDEEAYYADSSYTKGVQTILWCLGYGPDGSTLATFADSRYGPGTAAAVESFQGDDPTLDVDGVVGDDTWGALRAELENLGTTGGTYDPYGLINDVNCGGQVLFYEEYVNNLAGGWQMADEPGSATQVPFSITF